MVRLAVRDTDLGSPPDFEPRSAWSLGMQTVSDLVGQLDGILHIGAAPRAGFAVRFAPDMVQPLQREGRLA